MAEGGGVERSEAGTPSAAAVLGAAPTVGLLQRARSGVRAAALSGWTLGMVGAATLRQRSLPQDRRYESWQRWLKVWAGGLLEVFGVSQAHGGVPPAPPEGPRLVVANHRSPLDITLMLAHFGGCVLSRADLAEWPVLGLAARRSDTIFVDRQDPHSGVAAVRAIRRRLQARRTVVVFPEGRTFEGDEVREFRPGAFVAARGLGAEVIPVGIAYEPGSEFWRESFAQHFARVAVRPRTRVGVCFGAPLPAAGSPRQNARQARRVVQELVREARALCHGAAV